MASVANRPVYQEQLWASPGIWAATLGFGAALGLIPAPIDGRIAVIVAIAGVVIFTTILVVTTSRLIVTDQVLVAGRAQVPTSLVQGVAVLTPEQMREARGVSLDARAYLCTRGWLPAGVRVTLNDPEDPTPYWLISSRHPDALAAAVSSGISRADRPA